MRWSALLPTLAAAALFCCSLGPQNGVSQNALDTGNDRCTAERAASERQIHCGLPETVLPACALAACSAEDLASIDGYLACVAQLPDCDRERRPAGAGVPARAFALHGCENALRLSPGCAFQPRVTSGIFE